MTRWTLRGLLRWTALALLLTALPAGAMTGSVVGTDRKPIAGAKVCYMLGEVEGLCVQTDPKGVYDLPVSHMSTIRVEASGFQPKSVTVGKTAGSIVLDRAASMWVRVRDAASGRTLPDSEVYLVFPSGRREGPLPANDKGVKIRTLVPGRYGVLARVEGYVQVKAVSVDLDPGSDEWLDVEMKRATPKKKR